VLRRLIDHLFGRRKRRRADILATPFPDAWLPYLRRAVPSYECLSPEDQLRVQDAVKLFIAEKSFLGCRGVVIDDEIKVIVAGAACLLLLGLPHLDVFPRLREIIIYPHDLREEIDAIGPDGRRYYIERLRAGEAWRRGPVVLAWNNVAHSIAGPRDGYNVVLHEFAHVIDLQNGDADGVPPLPTREQHSRWIEVMRFEFEQFVKENRRGEMTFIDPYAATDMAEFFAVSTEHFYEQPRQMRDSHPDLYELFVDFFGRDPTTWRRAEPSRWQPRTLR